MVQHSDTATHIKWKIFDLVSTFFVTFKIMIKCDIRLTILLFFNSDIYFSTTRKSLNTNDCVEV